MALKPTDEQEAARDAFVQGRDLALIAGAGTGKTSTLILMGASVPNKRGIYVSFNKEIAENAKTRFGPNVQCRTAHSLAFQHVGKRFKDRLDAAAHLPARETARRLGITTVLDAGAKKIEVNHQARLVMGMVRRFCFSTAREVCARHLEPLNGLDPDAQAWAAAKLLPYARAAWEDLCSPEGRLRFEHDHYLKMWAMTAPQLPGDFVLLDEAQDTNPVLEEIFLGQSAQRVCVGDPSQQIYGWRFARDVMTGFPAEHLYLTQSFRFGPAVAEQANRWLGHAESDLRLTGAARNSAIATLPQPDAVLCRSNAHAMREVLSHLELGIRVELWGGGGPLRRIAEAAQQLKDGKRTSHPELFLFDSWAEVQEYVENDKSAGELKALVAVVDKYGPETIIEAVDRLAPRGRGQVIVSTAHKAKGREWPRVRIAQGFDRPPTDDSGTQRTIRLDEARLAYVAVTRAMDVLDIEGVAWLDEYEQKITEQSGQHTDSARLVSLALTHQLRFKDAPVTAFLRRHLPGVEAVRRDYLSRLAGLPYPVQPLDVHAPAWDCLGHAIDYRLRMLLGQLPGQAVVLGVKEFDGDVPQPVAGMLRETAREAVLAAGEEMLQRFAQWRHNPAQATDEQRTRLAFVAAQYERTFRSGQLTRDNMLAGADEHTTLDDLMRQVPRYVVEDIAEQMSLAHKPFAPFLHLPENRRICGPTFDGSADIGGADADYILDGLLLDCKATIHPRSIGAAEIYQLAGYLLLDYTDTFAIDRVGIYLSRQGGLITWAVTDFLTMLGARAALPELRKTFQAALLHCAHPASDPGTPGREQDLPSLPKPSVPATRQEPPASNTADSTPNLKNAAFRLIPGKRRRNRPAVQHVTIDGQTTACRLPLTADARTMREHADWHLKATCYNCAHNLAPYYTARGYIAPANSRDFPPRRS
ncbi:UvrD-helicase domain-containing protein [Streptomyces sp. Li-HN-5-11]|uniref:UvrD-helicase domain-containing protein n=1 Tax=Streptomyces sp. Li-HN-5-11 TaxID=3075432 RepID=UPI0028A83678|nr:UvrD-helicase domain-containing protein [Streptomyces sp. Li-HN-5-11]WNM32742.1 UvrD-helicase domain-containing protein [Streptomyces sp. Li-HN-5-11]WOP38525.1 UvrD-helicase domain-containing protein [Streptomyces sp. Li-HN-5-13]